MNLARPTAATKCVGRTPSSAPDALVRLFPCPTRPTRGAAAGQGARPTKSSRRAKKRRCSSTDKHRSVFSNIGYTDWDVGRHSGKQSGTARVGPRPGAAAGDRAPYEQHGRDRAIHYDPTDYRFDGRAATHARLGP